MIKHSYNFLFIHKSLTINFMNKIAKKDKQNEYTKVEGIMLSPNYLRESSTDILAINSNLANLSKLSWPYVRA